MRTPGLRSAGLALVVAAGAGILTDFGAPRATPTEASMSIDGASGSTAAPSPGTPRRAGTNEPRASARNWVRLIDDIPDPAPATGSLRGTVSSTIARSAPGTPGSDHAVLEDCRERFVITPGVSELVRRRVPDRYTLRRNSAGDPLMYVTAIRCQGYTADGVTRPTTVAAFGASVESPDGTACASRWPLVGLVAADAIGSCHNYLLFTAYDHPEVVEWARAGVPDLPTYFVPELHFDEGSFDPLALGVPLRFYAGGETPSQYRIDAVIRERPVETPLTGSFWFESGVGTVRFRFETDNLAFGEADAELSVEPGSEMAELLGTADPAGQPGFSYMAGTRWTRAELTKTVTRH